jgi:hypothetical protein
MRPLRRARGSLHIGLPRAVLAYAVGEADSCRRDFEERGGDVHRVAMYARCGFNNFALGTPGHDRGRFLRLSERYLADVSARADDGPKVILRGTVIRRWAPRN